MRKIHPSRRIKELLKHYKFFTAGTRTHFHYVNTNWFKLLVKGGLKLTGLYGRGLENALKVQISNREIFFKNLPEAFDGYRILYLSDLHIEAIPRLTEIIIDLVKDLNYDICLLGGDYRNRASGSNNLMLSQMKQLLQHLTAKSAVYGIMGNHDEYIVLDEFEKIGVKMLVNENIEISTDDSLIQIVGLDDCHYYNSADLDQAEAGLTEEGFKILLCHSPEFYHVAEERGYSLYLAGHTHGGQICLPGGIPILANARIMRKMISGYWQYGDLQGYTCRGTGSGIVPVRFFCPPEILLMKLKSK